MQDTKRVLLRTVNIFIYKMVCVARHQMQDWKFIGTPSRCGALPVVEN